MVFRHGFTIFAHAKHKQHGKMILVFGGTTEGRKAAEVLDEAGSPYFYSTKTGEQVLTLKHGQRMDGALDGEAMRAFCLSHGIRLIVDVDIDIGAFGKGEGIIHLEACAASHTQTGDELVEVGRAIGRTHLHGLLH